MDVLRGPLADHFFVDEDYVSASHQFEFCRNLLVQLTGQGRITAGEFAVNGGWSHATEQPRAAQRFLEVADRLGENWPWSALVPNREALEIQIAQLGTNLRPLRQY